MWNLEMRQCSALNVTQRLLMGGMTVALVACGGGGGGSASSSTPEPTNWSAQAYIKPSNPSNGSNFGYSIALDADTMVVGAAYESTNQSTITNGTTAFSDAGATFSGAAYVFKRTGSNWAQEAYLKAPNVHAQDSFGSSVAVSGDTLIVGAAAEASNQTTITTNADTDVSIPGTGAAYVFKRTNNAWALEAYIKPSNGGNNTAAAYWSNFGGSVSLDGDTAVVGAPFESSAQTFITNGSTAATDTNSSNSGAAYVYKRSGTTWVQEAYLKASNAETWDMFGYSLSLSGNTVLVGAYGEASNQTTITNGTSASADNTLNLAGAAYVFTRSGSTWTQEAYLKAPNASSDNLFGLNVALSGDTAVVGAQRESSSQTTITNGTTASTDNSATRAGAAYVFKRTGTTWAQEAYLKAPNAVAQQGFGEFVAIAGNTVVVSSTAEASGQTTVTNGTTASNDVSAPGAGAVYVFKRTGTTWAQQAYLKAPNAQSQYRFGYSVAVHGNTVAVGSGFDMSNQDTITNGATASADTSLVDAGAAHAFVRQ